MSGTPAKDFEKVENEENPVHKRLNNIMGENIDPYKIPQAKGDKTIKCWSCETIMMVKDDWNVVQCPTCEKVNKIPENKNSLEYKIKQIQFNNNINHFDVNMPYVYAILICPFCRTDNKVRVNSEHMVCYKCHNSVNITKENGTIKMTTGNNKFGGNNQQTNNMNIGSYHPQQKALRFSDLFFPDPMFYPGYYPITNSYSPMFPAYDYSVLEEALNRRAKYELFQYHINKGKDARALGRNDKQPGEDYSVRARLKAIKENLNLKDLPKEEILNHPNNNVITGYEQKIENIKDKLQSNKKSKNQAIFKNIFGEKQKFGN